MPKTSVLILNDVNGGVAKIVKAAVDAAKLEVNVYAPKLALDDLINIWNHWPNFENRKALWEAINDTRTDPSDPAEYIKDGRYYVASFSEPAGKYAITTY